MNVRLTFLLLFALWFQCDLSAQSEETSTEKKNAIIAVSTFPGLQYERNLNKDPNLQVRASLGLSFLPKRKFTPYYSVHVPIAVVILTGKRNGHFEGGIGYERSWTFSSVTNAKTSTDNFIHARLGYRYQRNNEGGLVLQVGIEPGLWYSWDIDYLASDYLVLPYLGVGWSF